eukprot:6420-Heterococcus_DN1.PRE.3
MLLPHAATAAVATVTVPAAAAAAAAIATVTVPAATTLASIRLISGHVSCRLYVTHWCVPATGAQRVRTASTTLWDCGCTAVVCCTVYTTTDAHHVNEVRATVDVPLISELFCTSAAIATAAFSIVYLCCMLHWRGSALLLAYTVLLLK